MSAPNLDAAIAAEVMEMTVYPAGTLTAYPRRDRHQEAMYYTRQPSHWLVVGTGMFEPVITGETLPVITALPAYSTDRNTCADAEARIVELGLGEAYTNHMIADGKEARQLPDGRTMSYSFYCLTASPEIRCQAMLKTVRAASVTK